MFLDWIENKEAKKLYNKLTALARVIKWDGKQGTIGLYDPEQVVCHVGYLLRIKGGNWSASVFRKVDNPALFNNPCLTQFNEIEIQVNDYGTGIDFTDPIAFKVVTQVIN